MTYYSETMKRPVSRPSSRKKAAKIRRRKVLKRLKGVLLFDIVLLLTLLAVFQLKDSGFFADMRFTMDMDRLERDGVPEELINLYRKNPDTRDFVLGYKKNYGHHNDIDISSAASSEGIPLFLQWDKRWGYETYGSNMMALTGCGPTCLSMVYTGLTGNSDMNPYAMAQKAESEGYYVWGSGSSWDMMNTLASEIGLTVHNVSYDEDSILKFLKEGSPIICIVGQGDFTESGHFIVLTGVDKDGLITVNDPNSRVNSEKHWDLSDIMPQILNLWGYSC